MATKREVLEALNTVNFEDVTVGDTVVTAEDIKNYVETTLAQLDNRAAKAAEKAAEKKAAGDEVRARIKAVLGNEPKTTADIVIALNDPEITPARVTARLTQLVNLGEVEKAEIKIGDRKLMGYTVVE